MPGHGRGVAFLVRGYRAVKRLSLARPRTLVTYLGISYCLLNWWAHDHLHVLAFTLDFNSLLWMSVVIDYVFHVGMMLLAAVMALFFVKLLTANRPVAHREEAMVR